MRFRRARLALQWVLVFVAGCAPLPDCGQFWDVDAGVYAPGCSPADPGCQPCPDGLMSLAPERICDGFVDCADGLDEQCFQCSDGARLPEVWRCDGLDDCGDCSDENGVVCGTVTAPECRAPCDGSEACQDREVCPNGAWSGPDGTCPLGFDAGVPSSPPSPPLRVDCTDGVHVVPAEWWCDGEADCERGEDEDCRACDSGGDMVPEVRRCDGQPDCGDGSDETTACTFACEPHLAFCDDVAAECGSAGPVAGCLLFCAEDDALANWCDGDPQCPDGEDELTCGA